MFQISAGDEGGDQLTTCDYAVLNRVQPNKCLIHPEASLIAAGSCSGCFMYSFPVAEADTWHLLFEIDLTIPIPAK